MNALQQAYSNFMRYIGNMGGGKNAQRAQLVSSQREQIFNEATKYFTPEAKARAANIPIQYQIMTNYPAMPTKLENSGLLWGNQDAPSGMYRNNTQNPSEARIFMRPNLKNAPQVLRHELIHSMDENINTPKMSTNQSLNGEERRIVDPILAQRVLFNNLVRRAYLLNSNGISSNFNNRDKEFLNNWDPKYSMRDTEAMAFLNDQQSSGAQLRPYYQKAIRYPENTTWSTP